MINNFCYIHIPFCTSKCKYCRFASFWNLDSLKVDLYVQYLLNEIKKNKIQGDLFWKDNKEDSQIDFKKLKSIYFGWWTPSILKISQLEKIINTLDYKYNFDKNIEINIEATPTTITRDNIIWWKKIWINRISIWIQTLNNDSLIEIWRGEKWDIINALNIIKNVGFNNVSIDFIIWLPYVKKWEIKYNIEYILNNYDFIKHISVYMLEEYYEIPGDKDSKFENITYPNNWNKLWIKDNDYLLEYTQINDFLKIKWFNRYEISNFAKKWYECKHNLAYWNHSNMLAFWLWAHGFINWERFSNSEEFRSYYSWNNMQFDKLTEEDIFYEKVMFQLRTDWLTKDIYEKLDQVKLNQFILDGFLEKKSETIIFSNKGVLVLDYILKEILI